MALLHLVLRIEAPKVRRSLERLREEPKLSIRQELERALAQEREPGPEPVRPLPMQRQIPSVKSEEFRHFRRK